MGEPRPKVIAFYLPQFHPIPENDEWWGKGFTEWRNVTRARPLYRGHYQPHLPADLGFYDLRLPEVREAQASLAKQYGIYGFCYYYYWFNGRRLLERPLAEVVAQGTPDLPFCICWANENWSRRWDGSDAEILLAQEHSPESDEKFILDALPILKDPRYIRVSGKPMLLVYRVDLLPRPIETAHTWRKIAAANGVPDLHLCAVQAFGISDPRPYGFDAAVEFPPHGLTRGDLEDQVTGLSLPFAGTIYDYREAAKTALSFPIPDYEQYRGVMVAWDNTPRRSGRAYVFHNATPSAYSTWLAALVQDSRARPEAGEFIFVNAWNEWAEGAHLEPDLKYGHAYLEATQKALAPVRPRLSLPDRAKPEAETPLVSVVIPCYNHANFVKQAIQSVGEQTYAHVELVIIDDGSSDASVSAIDEALSESPLRRVVFRTQPNIGAAATIDRGIMLSSGKYVAILNSDDTFASDRIEGLLRHAPVDHEAFLFSGTRFYCGVENRVIQLDGSDPRVKWYQDALRLAAATPTAGFAALGGSVTVSTSNFFFSRSLFDKVGGFNNDLRLCHDWDFVLRATRFVEPRFVPDELLTYRFHRRNSLWGLTDRQLLEGQQALHRYLEFTKHSTDNVLAPTAANWPAFFEFFCSRASAWFYPAPLARFVPGSDHGHSSANGSSVSPRDATAIRHFADTLRTNSSANAPVGVLRAQIARNWARTSAAESPPVDAFVDLTN